MMIMGPRRLKEDDLYLLQAVLRASGQVLSSFQSRTLQNLQQLPIYSLSNAMKSKIVRTLLDLSLFYLDVLDLNPVEIGAYPPSQSVIADSEEVLPYPFFNDPSDVLGGADLGDLALAFGPSQPHASQGDGQDRSKAGVGQVGFLLTGAPNEDTDDDDGYDGVEDDLGVGEVGVDELEVALLVLLVLLHDDFVYSLDHLPILFLADVLLQLLGPVRGVEGQGRLVDADVDGVGLAFDLLLQVPFHHLHHVSPDQDAHPAVGGQGEVLLHLEVVPGDPDVAQFSNPVFLPFVGLQLLQLSQGRHIGVVVFDVLPIQQVQDRAGEGLPNILRPLGLARPLAVLALQGLLD